MAKIKQSNTEVDQTNQPEISQSQASRQDERNSEVQRRLEALDQSLAEVRKSHLESHKWFTTVIFSVVAILLAVWGNMSRTDVRESIKDMQTKIDKATAEMEKSMHAETSAELDALLTAILGRALKGEL